MIKSYNAIDLFSGAGGLHLGSENAGFNIRLCIDNNDLVERTHKRNFPNIPFINKDINKVEVSEIGSYISDVVPLDIIIG